MTFANLPDLAPGYFRGSGADTPIQFISIDSRKSYPGSGAVFFCLSGQQHDGHNYAEEAYGKGWRFFVVEYMPAAHSKMSGAGFYVVESSLVLMQKIVAQHRRQFAFPVVGITGSNGKTIVKEWLYQLLAPSFSVIKSPRSYNSQVGVPLSVWAMAPNHNLAIFEAGISEPGEMSKLEQMIKPDVGILTNLGSAHDASFESPSHKLKEKLMLFAHAKKLIYCADHPAIHKTLQQGHLPGVELVSWGSGTATYSVKRTDEVLEINSRDHNFSVPLPFSDPKSVENLCHCIVAALELAVPVSEILKTLASFREVPMRMVLRAGMHGSLLVDDSYNNDLQGLEAALDFLKAHSHGRPLTVILSDILQSQGQAALLYKQVNQALAAKGVSQLVAIGPALAENTGQFSMKVESFADIAAFFERRRPKDFAGEAILIKGARTFGFEEIVRRFQAKIHRTVLEINLEALQHNFQFYRGSLPAGVKTMVMLKAFAYGSGSAEIGRTLQYLKADYIAVAFPDEGVALRQQGISIPIMVMNAPAESYPVLQEYKLEPEIYSFDQLNELRWWLEGDKRELAIHLKLDTGMHRLGFVASEWPQVKEQLQQMPSMRLTSIFTHLAASESPALDSFTHEQVQSFLRGFEMLKGDTKPMRHALNTAGITRFPEYHFDMVRIGIGLHGVESTAAEQGALRPVATLKTVVSQVKRVIRGESIGYGRKGVVQSDTRIATLAIGYADGYGREFGLGNGKILIKGQHFPTIGSICMDMTMVDVGDSDVEEGDEAIIFGHTPTVQQLAQWARTIPYEILTSISERVKREYISE